GPGLFRQSRHLIGQIHADKLAEKSSQESRNRFVFCFEFCVRRLSLARRQTHRGQFRWTRNSKRKVKPRPAWASWFRSSTKPPPLPHSFAPCSCNRSCAKWSSSRT